MEIEFIQPWRELSAGTEATSLQRRLEFEVTPLHALWEKGIRVVGRNDANDDIVVAMSGGGFAIVHLVWGESPGDALWPASRRFSSADEISQAMREWSREAGYLNEEWKLD
ncbi:hypothetical protein [Phenylobacterium montanum]|uniref:Uncharacterized protein n=1 Tax=Phenylobacterium montanum TaxID=2823693 RepID=A0A975G3V5_9CAUL|nr:hypothetical protein [Caulobacter sp. S6]QUD90027.1 hypothetical protein KCG34_09265 [Caulobacter sp. S6]